MRSSSVGLVVIAAIAGGSGAVAGPKDESSVAEWFPLIPNGFNEWRKNQENKGLDFGAVYVADIIANTTGGFRQGTRHLGRLELSADADLEKLAGWSGATVHASMLWIYGQGLTRNNIGNIAQVSEIEALPDTRLYEAWIEQSFWNGKASLKVGQQVADVDFFDSQTDNLFLNATFGWPAKKAVNLPAGGAAPPIATVGIRLAVDLSDQWTAYAAIFNGNPARPGPGDPQLRDSHGLAFRLNDSPWLIGQVRYEFDSDLGWGKLPANIAPGAWYHTGTFDSMRFTSAGISIADPAGSGVAGKLRGNFGVYAVFEHMLARGPKDIAKGVTANEKGITAFARVAYGPPDRNLIEFYADAGIGFNNILPFRPDDRFGLAIAYLGISKGARELDRDMQIFNAKPTPVRSYEFVFEAIYEAHVKHGWFVQPFFQYIVRPSGGVPNPGDPAGISRIGDAAVFGLTTTMRY